MEKEILIERVRALTTPNSLLCLLNDMKAEVYGTEDFPFRSFLLEIFSDTTKNRCYKTFSIQKKSGGCRTITSPRGNLKWIQQFLLEIFQSLYKPSDCAIGFVKNKSIIDNASLHVGKNYVFNVDLKDFFTSITRGMITGRLCLSPFSFNRELADLIAGLCCDSFWLREKGQIDALPQGAPTSPILSNAVCDRLDEDLSRLAQKYDVAYSRYADDLTFSSNHNIYQESGLFRRELGWIIRSNGLFLNSRKTRLQHKSERQDVTGLIVNTKVNINRSWIKDLRAVLHIWEKYGYNAAMGTFYPRYMANKGYAQKGEPDIANVISGKLCYLKMVKGEDNPLYQKLLAQYERILGKERPSYSKSWEYVFTMPFDQFQKHLHTKVEIRYSKDICNNFGWFNYHGHSILVAVSRRLDVKHLPPDAEISLCRYESSCPREPYLRVRHLYLLHRKHSQSVQWLKEEKPYLTIHKPFPKNNYYISPEMLKTIDKLKEIFPDLLFIGISDENSQ